MDFRIEFITLMVFELILKS